MVLAHYTTVMENEKSLNPWFYIWFAPRACIRRMLDLHQKRTVVWLAILAGIFSACSSLIVTWGKYTQLPRFEQFGVILAQLFFSVVLTILYLYVLSWVYQFVGRWLKGQGDYRSVKMAVGWSFYPWTVTAILATISLIASDPLAQRILGVIYIVIAIWSFIIFLKLIAEAHRFSFWRAFGCFAIVLGLILLVGLTIFIIQKVFAAI